MLFYYWQRSAAETSTQNSASSDYPVFAAGQYFIRQYSVSGSCWTTASQPVNVVINSTPPIAEVSQVKRYGYTEIHFTHVEAEHILQHANYYWVQSSSATQTDEPFKNGYKFTAPGTYYLRGKDKLTGTWGPALIISVVLKSDNSANHIHSKSYDGTAGNTKVVAESRSYFDDSGRWIQVQTRNIQRGSIFTSTDLYDKYNRVVGHTLPAPLAHGAFGYHQNLLEDITGNEYDETDFDQPSNRHSPGPVGSSQRGTVGWYYSPNNVIEPNIGKTSYPYSRVEYYEDGSGEVKFSAAPGDEHRLGSGHEVLSGTFPIVTELDDYLGKRRSIGLTDVQPDNSLKWEGLQKVARDENGKYTISFANKDGKTVMTASKGSPSDFTLRVNNQIALSSDKNSADFRKAFYFYILDDQVVTFTFTSPEQALPSGNVYGTSIVRSTPITTEKELIASQSVQLLAGARITATVGKSFRARISSGEVGTAHGIFTIENLITGQQFVPTSATWPAGFYKVNVISGNFLLSYSNYYKDVSCQFYNDAGRMISSVSPNGYQHWAVNGYPIIDKTTYEYNHQGWLLSMKEPDAGETRYRYRRDGKIRFSQNALQRDIGSFLYTNYDHLLRPVESGEYVGAAYAYATADVNGSIDGVISDKKDWVRTYYDKPYPQLATWNLPAEYNQDFLRGAVSYTENENITTVYSYDDLGRVTWMAQKPKLAPLARVFTTRYTYDFLGNVLQVSNYAFGGTSPTVLDQFHHHYQYDADKRLIAAHTSTNGTNKQLKASYTYYLHGPLKRVELGYKVQGIDYLYNANGWLTHINHPDIDRDPGRDGDGQNLMPDDVFGMKLDYYDSELPGLLLTQNKLYNGLITSTQWRTRKVYGSTQSDLTGIYSFTYDEKYQIKEAKWSNPNGAWTNYTSGGNKNLITGMSYDPNGNILAMKRYSDNSALQHNLSYTYAPNKNTLNAVIGYVQNYEYDKIGRMIKADKTTGADQYVNYDVTGKVTKVFSDVARQNLLVEYKYDDRGFRMAKLDHQSQRATWYVRDASGNIINVYESAITGAGLKNIETPVYASGKIGTYYSGVEPKMSYELTDHLGNVRALVRRETMSYLATMEDTGIPDLTNPRVSEMQSFENIEATEVEDSRMNRTPLAGAEYSAYLNWVNGMPSQNRAVGPAIALKVEEGDTLDLEVWVRYKNKLSFSRNLPLASLASLLGGSFTGGVGLEALSTQQVSSKFNAAIGAGALYQDPGIATPFAYMNYVFLDENLAPVVNGQNWVRVPSNAGFNSGEEALPNRHQKMSLDDVVATHNGYIYIWLSNLSENSDVWFDDFKVLHRQSIVTQATDFGVWGDVVREQKIDPSLYRFGYQGQFAEMDKETGWNHFELREYDAVIGRWTSKDPKRQHWSPYAGMSNNGVNTLDPDGGLDWFVNNKTGQLLHNPYEGRGYEAVLGKDWSWFAEDGVFNIYMGDFDPNNAAEKWFASEGGYVQLLLTLEQSQKLMSAYNFELSPLASVTEKAVFVNQHIFMPYKGSVSYKSSSSSEVWTRVTYAHKNAHFSVESRVKTDESLSGGGYRQIYTNEYHYYRPSWYNVIGRYLGGLFNRAMETKYEPTAIYKSPSSYPGGPLSGFIKN